jgi:transcriptional regulator with XRE-family HTH domain
MHNETIGDRIKLIRKSKGLSQAEFAETLSLTQGFISKVEINRAQFTIEHVVAIAHIYNIDLNWLLVGEGKVLTDQKVGSVVEMIDNMLENMDEERQRDVLKYASEKKQLMNLIAESQTKKAG